MRPKSAEEKKIITAYVSTELLTKAREYGINISKAASEGIRNAVEREEKMREMFPEGTD